MSSSTPSSASDRPVDARPNKGRRRTVTVLLTAALAGAVGAGAYEYFAPQGASVVAQRGADRTEEAPELVAFTDADTADCVNWSQDGDIATDFAVVDCASPHRFEVATREDLSQYPTSEFGPDAPQPDLERQGQLTSELCEGPTRTYLDGRLDPQGRYSIVPILPPEAAWDGGDRTMLCGVAVPQADGNYAEATGRAAETDQSPAEPAETCMRAQGDAVDVADCDRPYSWQVTSVVNLGDTFDGAWPTIEQQNDHLDDVCTAAAIEFLGGGDDENLYQSTLTPFWTTLPQESWNAGSRTVNCALTKARDGGGFADLQGDVRGDFTIDGNPPEKQPERNPRRDNDNNSDSASGSEAP
ncbi:MAG: septum formation family protein [Corynebacterium sp.]|jgi:hypothetical protein|uniref:septum formation family protein n=1 Tax=unclassified Corynebacterium TaxID=2624378 RepID=UPI00095CF62A|nr:septum formation family protein [Corynebacterium sp. CNJ-954]OLT52634.1 hypothetical protein BJF89_03855 [Corynebacterium sp. CNJ-954]